MINTYLQIVQGLSTEFTHLKDNTLYLFTDTKQIFLGKEEYMSNLSKETFEDLINSIIQTQLPAEISSLEQKLKEEISKIDLGDLAIDNTYNPDSNNAQSGLAVKQAINTLSFNSIPVLVFDTWEQLQSYQFKNEEVYFINFEGWLANNLRIGGPALAQYGAEDFFNEKILTLYPLTPNKYTYDLYLNEELFNFTPTLNKNNDEIEYIEFSTLNQFSSYTFKSNKLYIFQFNEAFQFYKFPINIQCYGIYSDTNKELTFAQLFLSELKYKGNPEEISSFVLFNRDYPVINCGNLSSLDGDDFWNINFEKDYLYFINIINDIEFYETTIKKDLYLGRIDNVNSEILYINSFQNLNGNSYQIQLNNHQITKNENFLQYINNITFNSQEELLNFDFLINKFYIIKCEELAIKEGFTIPYLDNNLNKIIKITNPWNNCVQTINLKSKEVSNLYNHVEQTYDPTSTLAISGKAVSEALSSGRDAGILYYDSGFTDWDELYLYIQTIDLQVPLLTTLNMSSDKYYNPDKNLVYSGLSVCLPIKTGEDPNWSGIRIYNLLNSDIWESWYELNEELDNWSIDHGLILNPLVDQVYNKNSNNAQSGIAVAEAIHNRFSENVDLYSAISLTEEDIELNDFGIYIYDETNNEIKSSYSNLTSYYPRLIPVKEKQIYRIITKKANESEITNYANAITYAIVKQNENNKLIVIEDKFNLIEEKIQINIIEIPQIDLNDTEKLYLCINSSWCENIQKQSSIKKVTKLELQSSSLTNKIIAYSNTKEHALDAAWNHYPEKIATQMHGGFIQMDEFNNKYIDNVDLICYNFFNNFNDDLSIGEVYEDYDITDMPDSYCKIIETFFQEALEKKGFLCCIIPNNMVFSLQLQMEKNQIETLVQQVKLICKKYAVPYYNDYETSGWSEKTDPDKAMPPPSMGKIKTFLNNLLV